METEYVMQLVDVSAAGHVIRVDGRTADGEARSVLITSFRPYFYVNGMVSAQQLCRMTGVEPLSVEAVTRTPIMPYCKPRSMTKVTVADPLDVRRMRDQLYRYNRATHMFDCNIRYPKRFLVDSGVPGASWVRVRVDKDGAASISHVTDEALAPMVILSFDIECASSSKERMPDPTIDPIITIAYVVKAVGRAQCERRVLALRSVEHDGSFPLTSFDDERDMLNAFFDDVARLDPDIVTGYNHGGFDCPYIVTRCKTLGIAPRMGRDGKPMYFREKEGGSKQSGHKKYRETTIPHRIVYDVLKEMQQNWRKLDDNTLGAVSTRYLKETKDDVHYWEITPMFNGTPKDRWLLAKYCLKDAELPMRLIDNQMLIVNLIAISRLTGAMPNEIETHGTSEKVFTYLLRLAFQNEYVVRYDGGKKSADLDKYKGAVVIDPEPGFYSDPIATLDYASLYPSIMRAYNLGPDTYVPRTMRHLFREEDLIGRRRCRRRPTGSCRGPSGRATRSPS